MARIPEETDVLVVGAGPAGLALAVGLKQRGLAPLVIDRQAAGANTSRAAVVHARTLEVLEPLGVAATLVSEGIRATTFRLMERDRTLTTVDFSGLPTAFPFALMIPQDRTEAVLLDRLRALGGEILRPAEATAIRPGPDRVEVDVAFAGEARTVRAKWLVGCDGLHSRVREAAGLGFDGGTYDQDFVLADVRMDWAMPHEEVALLLSPEGMVLVAPLPGDPSRYRIVATTTNAPPQPDVAFMQAILDARGPRRAPGRIREALWSSRFRIHHRLATSPRAGRILLCGDAAHVHSPAGGQGMNTGIQDGATLADALVSAVCGDEGALDAWATARHRVAESVVGLTDRMTRVATLASPPARALRNGVVSLVGRIPAVRHAIARRLSQIDYR